MTALGVIHNNQGGSPIYTAANPFDTYTPGADDILVKYTYFGDANLDGKVDGSDYSLIDNAYNRQNVNLSTTALVATPTALVAAVPEPAGLAVVAVGVCRRRGRRAAPPARS